MTDHKYTNEEIIADLQGAAEWFRGHGKNTNTAVIGICERAVERIKSQEDQIKQYRHDEARLIKERDEARNCNYCASNDSCEKAKHVENYRLNGCRHFNDPIEVDEDDVRCAEAMFSKHELARLYVKKLRECEVLKNERS